MYIDGILVGGNTKWSQVFSTTVPSDMSVISVDCYNSAAQGGLLASIDALNIVTDSTWRCTRSIVAGWNTRTFDDTQWPDANVIQGNVQSSSFPQYTNISLQASWITLGRAVTIGHMYCRKHIRK